jgi:DNA-binding HxlR family transcriptional regulator
VDSNFRLSSLIFELHSGTLPPVPEFRYAQFCPLARAAELLGERWTLLVVRELLVGPQRFSDLRRRLPGVSSSILAERLERLERRGIVRRAQLPPPAASAVYELDEAGEALLPVVTELLRWGSRWLLPAVPGDHFEPDWVLVALRAFALPSPTPERRFELRLAATAPAPEVVVTVEGGPAGTRVAAGPAPAPAVRLRLAAPLALGLMAGRLDAVAAQARGALSIEGDPAAVADFPRLFAVDPGARTPARTEPPPSGAVPHTKE